ncbi:ATPase PAAT [Betta splendens]|uniref:ATPase PAAT n=1 Tax=Betta splendens TaxID=158456 RepID=A0A6P7L472_BETSP|nr:ATPase PAAT [Betta splendens]
MVDIASGAAWVCRAQDHHLADVLLPVHINSTDSEEEELSHSEVAGTNVGSPVLLEQTEDGSPCVLTVQCSPNSGTSISRLLVISEARTVEVYDHMGEYCGTVRGERDDRIQPVSEGRGPFYRKQLTLEHPSPACNLKLLSLASKSSVVVCRVVVGLQLHQPCKDRGPGIDMQQVQCLVEEMGTSLSPGAQNLMEMVQFQQKNQTSSLGGFLPLLMSSGTISALAHQRNTSSTASLVDSVRPPDQVPPSQNGTTSGDSSSSSPDLPQSDVSSTSTRSGSVNYSQLAGMMSHFLKGQGCDPALSSSSELLPILQSVCGQVTQLRLDDAAVALEKEKLMGNGTWELDSVMERRLEEMERRLKEHLDRRLDALEEKLEKALLSALPLVALNQGAMSSALGAASAGSLETGQTPAMH